MWKKLAFITVLGLGAWFYYDYKRAGFDTMPELPEGAFPLSFKGGLRGIVVNQEDLRDERSYASLAYEVPEYLERAWSTCEPATDAEKAQFPELEFGYRPEAVCRFEIEGKTIVRGLLVTRPKLGGE